PLPRREWFPTWYRLRADSPEEVDQDAATKAAAHANTPSVVHLDVLARPTLAVGDLRDGKFLKTRTNYDVQGNVISITDPREILAFEHEYDMVKRQLSAISVDAGHSRALPDAAGSPFVNWDANGNKVLINYDELRRPTERWVRRRAGDYHLTQKTFYGESA